MASACAQSVFGFGAHLDRRPTIFVPELASKILCSLCGLLPATSFMLPCNHLLCVSCFHQYSEIRDYCPLDKRTFTKEEVGPAFIKSDDILALRIRCWNAGNGCDAEDAVSGMLDHFVNACMFHTVNCRTCGEKILHRELPGHVISGCAATRSPGKCDKDILSAIFPDTSEMLEKTSRESASLQMGLASFELRMYEMKEMMDHLSATVSRMKAEADQIKGTTCAQQIDSWISEVEAIICTNENTFMTFFKRISYSEVPSLNKAAHPVAENHAMKCETTDPAFLKSSGPVCPGTTYMNSIQRATAEGSNVQDCKPPLMYPQPSLLRPQHDTKVSEIQECCDVIIENWTHFSAGYATADIRNGRCECRVPIHGYGFLLIPLLHTVDGISRVHFTVYAFNRFFNTTHEAPPDCVLRMRLVSRAGGVNDACLKEHISWTKARFPRNVMGEETLYFFTSPIAVITTDVQTRGFVSGDQVQVRFSVTGL